MLPILGSILAARTKTEQHSGQKLAQQMIRDFMNLNTFRDGLSNFLVSRNLPTALCAEDARWYKFLTAYGGVIEDVPLSCKAKRKVENRRKAYLRQRCTD